MTKWIAAVVGKKLSRLTRIRTDPLHFWSGNWDFVVRCWSVIRLPILIAIGDLFSPALINLIENKVIGETRISFILPALFRSSDSLFCQQVDKFEGPIFIIEFYTIHIIPLLGIMSTKDYSIQAKTLF